MTRYRGPHTDETSSGRLFRLFVGDDLTQVRRWGGIGSVLFGISAVVMAVASPSFPLLIERATLFEFFVPFSLLHDDTVFGTVVILGWIGLAMWPAYRNAGLLVSWGLLVSPMWGALLSDSLLYYEPGLGIGPTPPYFFLLALLIAIALGTCGFLLGTGFRRIRAWNRDDRRG